MRFSRSLALVAGLVLPILETIRRWHELGDWHNWPFWLDDFGIAGMLLLGFWQTRKDLAHGRPYLAAAWGFACSGASDSFFFQLVYSGADPSGASQTVVVVFKAMMLALAVAALVLTLRWKPANPKQGSYPCLSV